MTQILNPRDLQFLLYEFLDTETLLSRERYAEHSRDVFDATLDTARQLAEKYFAPHLAKGDREEPRIENGGVRLIPEAKTAWDAFADAGFLRAHCDGDEGGLQVPEVILRACMAWFNAGSVGLSAYPMLSIGVINLIRSFGSPEQVARFVAPLLDGRWAGTMALTEPAQGSSLADIRSSAVPQADGSYRVFGTKMFISGGEQDLTGNIVHMVLARIKGAPPGAKGISLFIVPKFVPAADGSAGPRNDVALTGLLHKMGWRQTSSTALTFGAGEGAVGFLLGEPHQGLSYMFQMMNEARIGVGLFASCIAYRGFLAALEYATHRPQGRLPSDKNPGSAQVRLIQHADVRRLLLAQKAYAEGALAMCLYASSLFEDQRTAPDETQRQEAAQVLDLLTPVIKSWPSRYGTLANELAIQVYGGAGYTREHPVEQLYRDQRLNSIHEGAEAIHGLDLLGRKIARDRGQALEVLQRWMHQTVLQGLRDKDLMHLAMSLAARQDALATVTKRLLSSIEARTDATLANATVYLDVLGRITAAWLWLKQAQAAQAGLAGPNAGLDGDFYRGKLQAARYYIEWELPAVDALIPLLTNSVPYDMQESWF